MADTVNPMEASPRDPHWGLLRSAPPEVFGPVDATALAHIEADAEYVELPGGELLFRQGDPGDGLYLVVAGRLRAVIEDDSGERRVVREMGRGESIGEMALVSGAPRSATIHAVRDSVLLRISKPTFERLVREHPELALGMAKVITTRLQDERHLQWRDLRITNVALVPATPGVPLGEFARRLGTSLAAFGDTLHLDAARLDALSGIPGAAETTEGDPRYLETTRWLDAREADHRFVVYEVDAGDSAWTRRCIRQADEILIVASTATDPRPGSLERALLGADGREHRPTCSLVLLHEDATEPPRDTSRFLAPRELRAHYHLRWKVDGDFDRIARFLSGNAVGLVLGGGGARGYAHIGVLHALAEAGIPIDLIGGTSVGAIIAGQYGLTLDWEEIQRSNRNYALHDTFANDYTLPIISFLRGHKFDRLLEEGGLGRDIEDLWIPYFCVSTNLTQGRMEVHRDGVLWEAVRASCSIPGIMPPSIRGAELFVDGGLLSNVPAEVMREQGARTLIVSDVSPTRELEAPRSGLPSPWRLLMGRLRPGRRDPKVPNIGSVLMRSIVISSVQKARDVEEISDLTLRPATRGFGTFELKAVDRIIEAGYQHARERLSAWQTKCE